MFGPTVVRMGVAFVGGAAMGGSVMSNTLSKDTNKRPENNHDAFARFGAPEPMVSAQPLCYSNHCLQFDPQRKTPIWVAEHMASWKVDPIEPSANRKRSKFHLDPAIAESVRSLNDDFWGSGWSRGHMAPAGNNKHSQQAMDETFLLSNIVPQDIDNNGDFWNRLEIYCRDLTKKFPDVWIISGPLWIPREKPEKDQSVEKKQNHKSPKKIMKYEVIGSNEVSVPTHLYKVVLAEDPRNKHLLMSSFLVPNKPIERQKSLIDFKVPIEELESRLGFKFHQKLNRSEAKDLCEVEGCQIMDYRKFQRFFVLRGVKGARNEKELERYWKKAQDLDLVDPEFVSAFEAKKRDVLKGKSSGSDEKRQPIRPSG